MKKLLVTAALPYSNGRLHVGHIAGCYLPADIYVSYQRMTGRDVRFICGSDDHGVAIILTADKEGRTPKETAAHYNKLQAKDFEGLGISFDIYSSTSANPYHAPLSQRFFSIVHEAGYFEKEKSLQFYDDVRGVFLPDRFVKGTCSYCNTPDQNGDQCENCGKVLDTETLKDAVSIFSGQKAIVKETVHWFLDLSRFEQNVKDWISSAKLRDHTRSYLGGLLGTGLVKRSMTRDLDWGVPVPLDEPDAKGKVLYVWFDAPIGYISNTELLSEKLDGKSDNYKDWWCSETSEVIHFIGEDNTIFHCVIWIAMLQAEGTVKLPKGVIVNQFLNIQFPDREEEKISKSRGTAIWIGDYLDAGGDPDVLRYYLSTIAPEKARTVYKPEDLINKNNTDLANTLGNFINRVLSFSLKHFGSSVLLIDEDIIKEEDRKFIKTKEEIFKLVTTDLDNFEFRSALEKIMEYARSCNRYIDEAAPWKTRKDDEIRTRQTLAICMDSIKFLSVVLAPYMPKAAERIRMMLGLSKESPDWGEAIRPLAQGMTLGEPEILFVKKELTEL